MSSLSEIKDRIKSVEQTKQITGAMYLMSVAKHKRALLMAKNSEAFYDRITKAEEDILYLARGSAHTAKYTQKAENGKKLYAVIMNDRGLCGGFDSEIASFAAGIINESGDSLVYCWGKRGATQLKQRGITVEKAEKLNARGTFSASADNICNTLFSAYKDEKANEIFLIFYDCQAHSPVVSRLFPLNCKTTGDMPEHTIFEPSLEETVERFIPVYLIAIIRRAIINSVISENKARTEAMQNASSNADEMLNSLQNELNMARQQIITNEITETAAATENLNGC